MWVGVGGGFLFGVEMGKIVRGDKGEVVYMVG